MLNQLIDFLKESYEELQKVTWLSRNEVIGSTIVIIILVAIMSIFVSLVDFVFIRLVGMVL